MSQALSSHWRFLKEDYKIIEIIGEGTYGEVVKGIRRETQQKYAIKCLIFDKSEAFRLKCCIREIQILKYLSQMDQNIYVV